MINKDSKIYVAGHTGLVGSAIWKNLQGKGFVNLIGKTIDELDLMNPHAVNEFFETEKPEYVFLAAAKVGGIVANNIYRGQFIYENLMIQNNVLHYSYKHQVKKLLFLGSTCIYPREAPQPIPENSLLTGPLEYTNEPYAIAKIAGIKMCESYNIQYGTDFISVMPTNLYGPNDNFDLEKSHVLPALIRKMHLGKCIQENKWEEIKTDLNKRPIEGINGHSDSDKIFAVLNKYGVKTNQDHVSVEIWGTGKPMREFLWSEELADACVYLLNNVSFKDLIEGKEEIRNTHINIGTGREISIKDLAFLIKEKTGFKGEIHFDSSKPDGTMRKLTNVSKLNSLGWKHQINIDEGIEKMYQWYLKK
jgi:GDP-L-fucose synthase